MTTAVSVFGGGGCGFEDAQKAGLRWSVGVLTGVLFRGASEADGPQNAPDEGASLLL